MTLCSDTTSAPGSNLPLPVSGFQVTDGQLRLIVLECPIALGSNSAVAPSSAQCNPLVQLVDHLRFRWSHYVEPEANGAAVATNSASQSTVKHMALYHPSIYAVEALYSNSFDSTLKQVRHIRTRMPWAAVSTGTVKPSATSTAGSLGAGEVDSHYSDMCLKAPV